MATWAAAALALVLVACGGSGEGPRRPTAPLVGPPPTTQAPSTTATTVDVTEVPAVIDLDYVQAVMDVLDGLLQEAARAAARDRSLGEEFQLRLRALYTGEEYPSQLEGWRKIVDRVAAEPARPTTKVLELISASRECVFFSAERILAPLLSTDLDVVQPYYLKLVANQPHALNPTTWALEFATFYRDGSRPPNQCSE